MAASSPFLVHDGIVVPLMRGHIDTDQIVPRQFLKRLERSGFGQFLFHACATVPMGSRIRSSR